VAPRLPSGSEQLPGLSIWGISVIWILLGWGGLVTPRRAAYVIGGIGALFAASVTATQDWGLVLALATTAALVGVGVLFRDLLLLAVGAVGALLILPGAIDRWFPGALAAPLALLVAGGVLVGAAVHTARSSAGHEPRPQWAPSTGPPGVALAAASGVALAVTAVVLILGLT
jgi:hypothetical protein